MNEHHPDHPHHGAASSVDRRGFLTAGAKAAAGLAAGGALLGATPGLAAADRARMSSVGILRKPPAQITFAATFNPSELVLWNTLIGQFQAQNPTIKVNLLTITANGGWGQYAEKVISLVAGGRPLDVIRIATEASRLWGAKNLALPLDPFITRDAHHMEDYLNDVSPKLTDVFRYKGQLLGLPFDWNNNIIWYNTAVFKKAGITPPGPNWSADEFVSVAKKVRATGAYGINLWANGTFGIVDWMYAAGGGLYNHDWTKSNATDPANVRAMQFLQDLIWTDKVAPRPGAPDFPLFEAGRVGMINAGRWPLAVFDQAKFYTYDIQYMPRLSPQRKTIFGVGALPIYKGSQHPEEAWTFLKYVASRPVLRYLARQGQGISPRRSIATDPTLMNPPHNYHVYYDSLAAAESVPAPPQFNEVETALNAGYTKLLAKEITPRAMLKQLDSQITSILAKPV